MRIVALLVLLLLHLQDHLVVFVSGEDPAHFLAGETGACRGPDGVVGVFPLCRLHGLIAFPQGLAAGLLGHAGSPFDGYVGVPGWVPFCSLSVQQ